MAINPMPQLWLLLREACQAGEAVDAFDMRTEDRASVVAFMALHQEQNRVLLRLLNFIADYEGEIRGVLLRAP